MRISEVHICQPQREPSSLLAMVSARSAVGDKKPRAVGEEAVDEEEAVAKQGVKEARKELQ